MSENVKTVDARGLSCPQPVLETKRAVEKYGSGAIEVLVDTVVSRENVTRFALHAGWQVNSEDAGGYFRITLKK